MGRQSPIRAPSTLSSGRPLRTTAISVVVPPISATMALATPLRAQAPITLAAGPLSTVPTGRASALAALISVPSPLTIISGASILRVCRVRLTESISAFTCVIMRALSATVMARRGAPRLLANSWPQVTGLSVSSVTHSRNCNSCCGLRTAKLAEIAKALTRGACLRMAALDASSSNGVMALPPASCPPGSDTMASDPSNSTMPLALICAASYPASSTQTGEPLPSTTELVVSVVDSETSATRSSAACGNLSSAPPMPTARSNRVVRLLAAAMTFLLSSSSTASVNVPPVSMPRK